MDIENLKIVGISEPCWGTQNARVYVVGYLDANRKFNSLTHSQAEDIFPNEGKIFAPHLQDRRPELVNKCIYLGIQPSKTEGKDTYIWDWYNGRADEYGISIISARKVIPTDIEHSITELKAKYIKDGAYYIHEDNYVYRIDENINKHYLSQWKLDDLIKSNPDNFVMADDKHYYILGDEITLKPKYVDIMPNKVLRFWISTGALAKNWLELLSGGNAETLKKAIQEVVCGAKGTPHSVIESRFDRVSEIIDDFTLSYEKLKILASSSSMATLIERSVEATYQHFISEEDSKYAKKYESLKLENEQKIDEAKVAADKEVAKIRQLTEEAKTEYDKAKSQLKAEEESMKRELQEQSLKIDANNVLIKQQKEQLASLEENRESVIKDFGVVKDVLSLINAPAKGCKNNDIVSFPYSMNVIDAETEECKTETIFRLRLSNYLRNNNRNPEISKKLFGLLSGYDVLLLPDERIITSLLNATGACTYTILNVTPEVRSFETIWNSGLEEIVNLSLKEANILHFFVVQNINISYTACYLQPIVNIVTGLAPTFPSTDIKFPENLKIILSPGEENVLPLAKQNIKYFGCLTKKDYSLDTHNEGQFLPLEPDGEGYFSAYQLQKFTETAPLISSDYISYIADEE